METAIRWVSPLGETAEDDRLFPILTHDFPDVPETG